MSRFGPYRLIRRLAVGGMGEIYLATLEREAGFEKELAIKRILPTLSDDPAFVRMFNREACVAARLNHAHIVQIFDYGQHDGAYFIAMEVVHGRDLRAVLEAARSREVLLSAEVAWTITAALAEALHYAHRRTDAEGRPLGLVHRDVSPHNVILSWEGEIKLTDFGLVQTVATAAQEADGVVRGKFAYMSPEQTWGDELDHRSDLFSLAVVAYELFTGRTLFNAPTLAELMDQIRADPPVFTLPTEARGDLPAGLDDILLRALAHDREARHPDVRAFLAELEALARQEGWTRSPVAVGAMVTALCPAGPGAPVRQGGSTQVSDQPIASRATEPAVIPLVARATDAAAAPLHLRSTAPAVTVPAARPIEEAASPPVELSIPADTASIPPARAQDDPDASGDRPGPSRRRARWVAAAGVGFALVAVAAVAAVVSVGRGEEEPGEWTLHIDAVPENSAVFVNGAPQGPAPARAAVSGGRTVEIKLEHAGYQTRVETLDLDHHGGTRRVHAVLEREEAQGRVLLDVQPVHAAVLVNGQPLEASAEQEGRFDISGEPGKVRIQVKLDGYQPIDQELEIPARSTARHTVQLLPGTVRVLVRPEGGEARGSVTIEARDFQTRCGLPCNMRVPYSRQGAVKVTAELEGVDEPWTQSQAMAPGAQLTFNVPVPAHAEVVAPGRPVEPRLRAVLSAREEGRPVAVRFSDVALSRAPRGTRSASLPSGVEVVLRHEYEPATRKLRVNLDCRPWCQISLDGRDMGQSPLTYQELSPGNHTILLKNHEAILRVMFQP